MAQRASIRFLMIAATAFVGASAPANAALVISDAPTVNVTCQFRNTCTANADDAVLNVRSLEAMLRTGVTLDASVPTKLIVAVPFQWSTPTTLTIEAPLSVTINAPITVTGPGGLAIGTSTGPIGGLSFGAKGSITFWDLSSPFQINFASYALVNSIASLASAIVANPAGNYALARSYNASRDGTYASSPIATFSGVIEGLGNTVSNYTEVCSTKCSAGFISVNNGTLRDFGLTNASVTVAGWNGYERAGLLVSWNNGIIARTSVSGILRLKHSSFLVAAGGISAFNFGQVLNSGVSMEALGVDSDAATGGLAGINGGTIGNSWATTQFAPYQYGLRIALGGLVGKNNAGALVERSWANFRAVDSGVGNWLGGLVGENSGFIRMSHAAAELVASQNSETPVIGGLVGSQWPGGSIDTSYATSSISGSDKTWNSGWLAGGLVGVCESGKIERSFATIVIREKTAGMAGGLVGTMGPCTLTDVYSTGSMFAELGNAYLGIAGLVGAVDAGGTVARAYTTGALTVTDGARAGGFVCTDLTSGGITDSYWDTTTTGIDTATCSGSDLGVKPLTTSQFQSELPGGFSPTVWAQSPSINGGFPFLLANPPPK